MSKLAMLIELLEQNRPEHYKDGKTGKRVERITFEQAVLMSQLAIDACGDHFASLTPGLVAGEVVEPDLKLACYVIAVNLLDSDQRQLLQERLKHVIDTSKPQFLARESEAIGLEHLNTLYKACSALTQDPMAYIQAKLRIYLRIIQQAVNIRENMGEDVTELRDQLENVKNSPDAITYVEDESYRAFLQKALDPSLLGFDTALRENLAALDKSLPETADYAIVLQHQALHKIWEKQLTDEQKHDPEIARWFNSLVAHQASLKERVGNLEAVAKWGRDYKDKINKFGEALGYSKGKLKKSKLPGKKLKLELRDKDDLLKTIKVLREAVKVTRDVAESTLEREKKLKRDEPKPKPSKTSRSDAKPRFVVPVETSVTAQEQMVLIITASGTLSRLHEALETSSQSLINAELAKAQLNAITHIWRLSGEGYGLDKSQLELFNQFINCQEKLSNCKTHAEVITWATEFRQELEALAVSLGGIQATTGDKGNAAALAALARDRAAGAGDKTATPSVSEHANLQQTFGIIVRCCDAIGTTANACSKAERAPRPGAIVDPDPSAEAGSARPGSRLGGTS